MNETVTKAPQNGDFFITGFMLSGVFCFVIAALFVASSASGHDISQPFSLLTDVVCR